MASQINVDLFWKTDKLEKDYLFADPDLPADIKLSEVVFLIWPHEKNSDDYPAMIIKKKEDYRKEENGRKVKKDKVWSNRD